MSEAEAVADTINTIEQLSRLGVDMCSISAAYVPPQFLARPIYNAFHSSQNPFRPPWLRSIIHVLQVLRTKNLGSTRVRLNQFDEGEQLPTNWVSPDPRNHEVCGCADSFYKALSNFREDGNYAHFENLPDTCCKKAWDEEMRAG